MEKGVGGRKLNILSTSDIKLRAVMQSCVSLAENKHMKSLKNPGHSICKIDHLWHRRIIVGRESIE